MLCSNKHIPPFIKLYFIEIVKSWYKEIIQITYQATFDNVFEIKMEHDLFANGYHRHEILFEAYDENDYAKLLTRMLHFYFDVYKEDALQFLKNNACDVYLSHKAKEYLGIIWI